MGDYVETIHKYGTTDSYSTESSELEHRTSKARYRRTNKKNYVADMTKIERRETGVRHLRQGIRLDEALDPSPDGDRCEGVPTSAEEEAAWTARYDLGKTQNHPVPIFSFLRANAGDPVIMGFLPNLKRHLLPRARSLFRLPTGHEDSPIPIFFQNDRIYEHKMIRFNYTTYDVRRAQDVVRPGSSIMVLSPDAPGTHPYMYARVLGIYHANMVCTQCDDLESPKRLDFLWVRWYNYQQPKRACRLDELCFPSLTEDHAVGFLDPLDVIRGCHIVPAFAQGRCFSATESMSKLANSKEDWIKYYISRFADRDLLMRNHPGLSVGHSHCLPGLPLGSTPETPLEDEEEERILPEDLAIEDAASDSDRSSVGELGLKDRERDDLGSEAEDAGDADSGDEMDHD